MAKISSTKLKNINNAFEYIKSSGGIDEYVCKQNGLTILLMEDHSAPVATFMVTYHVGSRNEAIGNTGSTHLLEHMMFKGSKNFNKAKGNPIWTVLQDVGAQINATTWMDRTNYFELLPSEHLESAIAIEADRMRNLIINSEDHQTEMTVVRNEFEGGENDPFGVLDKHIWATAYQAHPYHHSTIGWRSDIENVSTEQLREFYNKFYWPNNATVTIIGDFDKENILRTILEKYRKIPKSPHEIPQVYTDEPEQEGARRFILKRAGQVGIVGIAHKSPPGLHRDSYALQILARILATGKTSRFYKKIIDKGLATRIHMFDFPLRDNGLFITYALLTPDTKHATVDKIILNEYENIQKNGIFKDELNRAIGQIHAEQAFSRDGSYSIASNLNEAIATGDWTYYTNYLKQISKITTADVQKVAQTYLIEYKSTTGYFVPQADLKGSALNTAEPNIHKPFKFIENALFEFSGVGRINTNIADKVVEQAPLSGIKLLAMKTGVQDAVTIAGSLLGGDVYSPQSNIMIAELTAAMLDQGTAAKTKFEIAETLEEVGASINFSSGQQHIRFNAKCLKYDVPMVLNLLAEQIRTPKFSMEDLKTLKTRLIGELKRAKENTRKQAGGAFLRKLYPKGHPNYSYEIDKKIDLLKNVKAIDLKQFHNTNYGLGNMLMVAVGDVDNEIIDTQVEKAFSGWQRSTLKKNHTRFKAFDAQANTEYISMKEKTSADIHIGLPLGIDRNHEDFYVLMIGTYILGGNFSARLMQTVRDEQGLTYGIQAWLGGVEHGNDGYWTIWATFAPQLIEQGHAAIMEQVAKWVTQGVSQAELDAKKSTITGTFKVGFANTHGVAGQLLTNAERGRDTQYLDKFTQIIDVLTLEQVNNVIKKYVNPDKLVFVAAGSFDEKINSVKFK